MGESGNQLVTGITPGIQYPGMRKPPKGKDSYGNHYKGWMKYKATSSKDAYYVVKDNDGDPYITYNTIEWFRYKSMHKKKNKWN